MSSPEFIALARTLAPAYIGVLCTWVAVRHGSAWEVRYCRMLFVGVKPAQQVPELQVSTPSLKAQRTYQALEDPLTFMNSLLADPLLVPRGELGHLIEMAPEVKPVFHAMFPPERPGAYRLATLRREVPHYSGTIPAQQLDLELLASATPYDGIADLYSELELPPQAASDSSTSVLDVTLLPVAAVGGASSLKDGLLHLELEAASRVAVSDIRVGVKAFKKNVVTRSSNSGDEFVWVQEGEQVRAAVDLQHPDVSLALVTLSLGGEFLHRWWVRDEGKSFNPRLNLHRTIDLTDAFRETFFDKHREDFEERVGLLFTMLGATVLNYGKIPRLTDAPDLLVYVEPSHLYVVECTIGDINAKGKLQKLHDRTNTIRERMLVLPSRPAVIQPIICTSAPRNDTASHWDTARNFGIAVMGNEELRQLMRQLEAPPTADQVLEAVKALIPLRAV